MPQSPPLEPYTPAPWTCCTAPLGMHAPSCPVAPGRRPRQAVPSARPARPQFCRTCGGRIPALCPGEDGCTALLARDRGTAVVPPLDGLVTLGSLAAWCAAVLRAYGPALPVYLMYAEGQEMACAPLRDARLQQGEGDGYSVVVLSVTRE